ncbi:unnamed protein product [Didymodactylos carnosus]|uniref:Protein kinase domain-containing protein n=1 Tax=Didymodactylos carnosus TaxID=1234261 RepID=A0A814PUA7_9BILA|nr:unnamed protein product [Didymodactylos carnosus]CAF3875005.1 unnamed protein product [Didymodactylos carnosus]
MRNLGTIYAWQKEHGGETSEFDEFDNPYPFDPRIYVNGHCFEVGYRYSQLKYLGDGAFGKVVSAYDSITGRYVAIKKIQLPSENRLYWTRTLRELCILHAVEHDNAVRLLNCFTNAKSAENMEDVYFVFNLMDMDLHEIIKQHRKEGNTLTPQHVQFLMYQLVRGVKFIHSANIMHRDLKPSNIFVTKQCDLRLGDFGLARIPEADDGQMTEYVATRWYRAPELMLAGGHYDRSADMWSVGCIFGELLRGQPLFPGTHYANQLDLIFQGIGYPKDPQQDLKWLPEKAKNYVIKRYQKCKTSLTETFNFTKPATTSVNKATTLDVLAIDLLEKMLQFTPSKRISADDAIRHPYFGIYRDFEDEPTSTHEFKLDLNRFSLYELKELLFKKVSHIGDELGRRLINGDPALNM